MIHRALPALGCVASLPFILAGCGPRDDLERANQTSLDPTGCSEAAAGAGFVSTAIGYEGNRFWADFTATPHAAPIDAVIGFADGPADAFSDLAATVRFNPDGFIDARDGDTYRVNPGQPLFYRAGSSYRFHVEIDITGHAYSATVTDSDGSFSWLAAGAAFRASQAAQLQLTHRVSQVDSASGGISVCDYSEPFRDRCARIDAGGGWQNQPWWPNTGVASFRGVAKPTQASVDAVLGVAAGPADSFVDLAAILRFNPSGMVDARNGSAYGAVTPFSYTPGAMYAFDLALDLRRHTYSATLDQTAIARDFAFRTEQAGVTRLDDSATFVDGASGGLILCNPLLISMDRASYTVPSQGGQLAIGSQGRLYEMSNAVTVRAAATGAVLASAPLRGKGRTDAAGNLYLAGSFEQTYDPGGGALSSAGGSDVFIAKYTPELAPIWARALGTAADDFFTDFAVDGTGRAIVLGPSIGTVVLDNAGNTLRQTQDFAGTVAANGAGELALAGASGGEIWVEKRDAAGNTLWRRAYATSQVARVAIGDGGEVAFAGLFHGIVSFGGSELRWLPSSGEAPNSAGYLVKLSPSGEHVWSLQNDYHALLSDLVIDGAGNVTFAGTEGSQILHPVVIKYAANDGSGLWGQTGADRGSTHGIAADADGAIYWSLTHDDYAQGTGETMLERLEP